MSRSEVKIVIGELSKETVNAVEDFSEKIREDMEVVADRKAKDLVTELKKNSPVGKRKKYRKSWRVKQTSDKSSLKGFEFTVYNTEASLTHLLEFGHASRNGGRVEAREHIYPARNKIAAEYIDEVQKMIKKGI